MAAAEYNITIEQGSTFVLLLTWKGSDSAPVDVTGQSARMQVRQSASSPEVLLELTTENGRIILGGAAGTVTLTVDAATTAAINWRRAKYDLELEAADGTVRRLISGTVTVIPEVTK